MNNKVLVGSRALEKYGIELKTNSDWDFLTEKVISSDGADSLLLSYESTNKTLFDISFKYGTIIDTPFGEAVLAPKAVLFIMYYAMQNGLMNYNYADIRAEYCSSIINKLEDSLTPDEESSSIGLTVDEFHSLVDKRAKETTERLQKQEENFFTKEVPRLIKHDDIHIAVANALGKKHPTFELILEDEHQNKGSKDKYEKLSHEDKISLVFEEIMVFAIERTVIPQIVAMPSMAISFLESCLDVSQFSSPANYWLYMFSKKGGVKKTPSYVSEFIKLNHEQIYSYIKDNWENTLNSVSQDFWEKVLKAVIK